MSGMSTVLPSPSPLPIPFPSSYLTARGTAVSPPIPFVVAVIERRPRRSLTIRGHRRVSLNEIVNERERRRERVSTWPGEIGKYQETFHLQ